MLHAWKLNVCTEPELRSDAIETLNRSTIAIFLLTTNFFNDERTLALLRHAVIEKKTCVIIVLPGQKWGEKRDKTFPENAFNPAWEPFCPDIGPAFAEIACAWENEYPDACLEELLKRVCSHLTRITGEVVVNMDRARKVLAEREEDALKRQAKQEPIGVALSWDWDTKVFDVFLSHKITDAKDVVLTWYNALSALGYHPFLDRLSLDAVENIPKYVEQTVTFAIAVTSNIWQSYWCAIELMTATKLHKEGKLNMLLIPIQGDRFKIPEGSLGAGEELDFPTPAIIMQNYAKWFAFNGLLSDESKANIVELYTGAEFTQCRRVKHTLMHYKSFERLFIARCGKSIKAHQMVAELVAAGGVTVGEQAEKLAPLIHEANTLRSQKGHDEFYEARVSHGSSVMGYANSSDVSSQEIVIVELMPGDAEDEFPDFIQVGSYSSNEFIDLLRQLRADHEAFGLAATSLSTVLEQWMVLQSTNTDQWGDVVDSLKEAMAPVKEMAKNVMSFFQISASFIFTFGDIQFPAAFLSLGALMGNFNFDFVGNFFEVVQAYIVSEVDYCSTSIGIGIHLTLFLVFIPVAYQLICFLFKPGEAKREEFKDHAIYMVILTCFLAYAVISMRMIKIFSVRDFGQHRLLDADWRVDADGDDYANCQKWGYAFLLLYTLGIPLLFFRSLWVSGRQLAGEIDITRESGEAEMRREQKMLRRYGLLYAKYRKGCWWWELVELARKLVLSSVLILIRPGTVSQVWFSLLMSMLFLLLAVFFAPYRDHRISFVSTACQLSTFLTLLCILALRTNLADEGLLTEKALSTSLLVLTILPLLLGVGLIASTVRDLVGQRKLMMASLPAAMRDAEPEQQQPRPESAVQPVTKKEVSFPRQSVYSTMSHLSIRRLRPLRRGFESGLSENEDALESSLPGDAP